MQDGEATKLAAEAEERFDYIDEIGCMDLKRPEWCEKKCPNATTCAELRCQRMCMVHCGECTPTPGKSLTHSDANTKENGIHYLHSTNTLFSSSVDCRWSPVFWGPCNQTCGGGTQSGVRQIEQVAKFGGTDCTGNTVVERTCNQNECPGIHESVNAMNCN